MSEDKKWLKELNNFFIEGDNWSIACQTVEAVTEIKKYWMELFWENVFSTLESEVDPKLWQVEALEEEVMLSPKDNKGNVKDCGVSIACDEEDGCHYGLWVNNKEISFGSKSGNYKNIRDFSEEMGLKESAGNFFYKSDISPYLSNEILCCEIQNDFKYAKKLALETIKFIDSEPTSVREVLLRLKK